jgi:hypothetical protein
MYTVDWLSIGYDHPIFGYQMVRLALTILIKEKCVMPLFKWSSLAAHLKTRLQIEWYETIQKPDTKYHNSNGHCF